MAGTIALSRSGPLQLSQIRVDGTYLSSVTIIPFSVEGGEEAKGGTKQISLKNTYPSEHLFHSKT